MCVGSACEEKKHSPSDMITRTLTYIHSCAFPLRRLSVCVLSPTILPCPVVPKVFFVPQKKDEKTCMEGM